MQYTHNENAERQEALYRFLLERGDRWTSMEQATDSIPLYPTYYTMTYHNSAARRLLTADIAAVNSSDRFEKIIISGRRGIKLANGKDLSEFLSAELAEIFRKLTRVRGMARKAERDQQIDFDGKIRSAFLGDGDG